MLRNSDINILENLFWKTYEIGINKVLYTTWFFFFFAKQKQTSAHSPQGLEVLHSFWWSTVLNILREGLKFIILISNACSRFV